MVSGGTVDAFEAIRSLDSAPPILVATSPTNGAVGVPADTNIVLTFNEPVVVASGDIAIHRSDDLSVVETIPVGDSRVTGSGTTSISVDLAVDLAADTGFYVTVASGALEDLVGNPYAGISDATALSFTTADVGEPTLVSSTPVDDATGVAAGTNITLVFSEDVNLGEGAITLVAHDGDTVLSTQVFDTAGDRGTGDGQIGGHGTNTVTINPAGDLASYTDYYLTVASTAITDTAGNSYAGISDPASLNFTTADTVIPQLVSTTPVDGATGVAVDTNITLVFSEDVSPADGNITIHDNTNGGIAATIPATGGRVTTDGSTVTIDPAGELASNADFWVDIAAGAFTDQAGNPYSGISDPTALVFTTADTTAPVLVTTSPLDGATGVAVATNITLTFTEPVYAAAGTITIHHTDTGTVAETISATSSQVSGAGTATVTIDPTGTLTSDTDYHVTVTAGAFQDAAGNSYAGVTNPTGLNFATADTTAPQLLASTPIDDATDVPVDTNLIFTFDNPVYPAAGTITIHRSDNGTIVETIASTSSQVTGSSTATITVNPATDLETSIDYYVNVTPGAFQDNAGNPYAGITNPTSLNFTSADPGAPQLVSSTPADDATGVAVDINLSFTFDEPVYAAAGDITIYRSDDGTVVEAIPVTGGQVTGSGTATITVNPTVDLLGTAAGDARLLAAGTDYYITVTPGAFEDNLGNPYAGITDTTSLNFTSADSGAPILVSSTPADDTIGVAVAINLIFVFDEPVYAAAGEVTIHRSDNGTVVEAIPVTSSQVTGSGTTTITVDPTVDLLGTAAGDARLLAAGTDYYINVTPGAFQDNLGNPYAGITNPTSLNFTSADPGAPQLLSSNPGDDTTGVPTSSGATFVFDEPVYTAAGEVTIHRADDGTVVEAIPATSSQVTGSGTTTITIDLITDLDAGTGYYINITPGAFEDTAGNAYAGITNTDSLNFVTADPDVPQLIFSIPGNDAAGVPIDTNLVFTFDEAVYAERDGSDGGAVGGDGCISGCRITINKADTNSAVETVVVDPGSVSSQVTWNANRTVVTVDLAGTLAPATGYYVMVPGGVFRDQAGNPYSGISGTALNFTTEGTATASGSISGVIWEDDNENGEFNSGEGIGDVRRIYLEWAGGPRQDYLTQVSGGNYSFTDLADGTYTLTYDYPWPHLNPTYIPSVTQTVVISNGTNATGINFGTG